MGGYFNRGASAGGHDEGYHNRPDITGPAGVGSNTGGPGGVARDDYVDEPEKNVDSAISHDEGYYSREHTPDASASEPDTSDTPRTDVEVDPNNPNIVRATPRENEPRLDETAGVTSQARIGGDYYDAEGTYPDIIEGSDSVRTGTSWGLPAIEDAPTVMTPQGFVPEGTGKGEAKPDRNVGDPTEPAPLDNVGAWGTMKKEGSAGSPTGES